MIKMLLMPFLLVFSLNANHIHWLGDYDKALIKAQKEDKPLMVLLVKKECSMCNKIIKKYFMEQIYIEQLNDKFISVIITYEGRINYPIELFYAAKFPTLFFVDSQTEIFLAEYLSGDEIDEKHIKSILENLQ